MVVNGLGEESDGCRVPFEDDPREPAESVFSGLREAGRPIPNLYRVLANAPTILQGWVSLAWPLRDSDSPRGLRELAIAYLATRRKSEYVRTHHTRFALRHGITNDQIAALRSTGWEPSDSFSTDQQLALRLVDDVVAHGAASAETIEALERTLGAAGTVELVVTVGFYECVCVVNRSLAVPLETASPSRP